MDSTEPRNTPWYRSTLAIALYGSVLMWAAYPPLALGWLAWIAPVPWLWLVRESRLSGRRPYFTLWFAALVFWLAAIHWLRLPHPALYLGWLALSAYLAIYLPLFIGLTRVAVHRLNLPLVVAAPVVYTGFELARAHVLTGFLMGSIAHTQVHWPAVIQVADVAGEYGVDFLMVMVAAAIASAAFPPRTWRPLACAAAVLALAIGYGYWRIDESDRSIAANPSPQTARVALIQGNSGADWKLDPNRMRQIMDEYVGLSTRALAMAKERGDNKPIDLVVWPETMFRNPIVTFDNAFVLPSDVDRTKEQIANDGPSILKSLVLLLKVPVLVGIERIHCIAPTTPGAEPPPPRAFNSAVLVDPQGKIQGTYDKVHRVVFGEFIPFADWLPFLYRLTPLTGGIQAGEGPAVLADGEWFYSPSICYETAVPHVMRAQANGRTKSGARPDLFVNLTNDAWYWGSSELDMHLACGVLRAVETHTPLVIAANGGISASIDRVGRVVAQSPRMQTDVLLADVPRGPTGSPYARFGDWFAATCLTACIALAIIGWKSPRYVEQL